MKTTRNGILIATVCVISAMAAPAMALDLYGFSSYWEREDVGGQWGLGVGCALPLFTDFLRLDGKICFIERSDFDGNDKLTMIPVDLGVQVHPLPDAGFDPYAVGGASFVYADAEHSDVDACLGTYLGAGLAWEPVSFIRMFGEVVYRFQELEGSRGDRLDMNGYSGTVGVRFSF